MNKVPLGNFKPVVAARGIMDRRGLMASLCLGAIGVQMGTAFLTMKVQPMMFIKTPF